MGDRICSITIPMTEQDYSTNKTRDYVVKGGLGCTCMHFEV